MKKQYEYYLNDISDLKVRDMANKSLVSEQLIRKYKNGHCLPRLETAVLLLNNFDIECEFWIIHNKKYKELESK